MHVYSIYQTPKVSWNRIILPADGTAMFNFSCTNFAQPIIPDSVGWREINFANLLFPFIFVGQNNSFTNAIDFFFNGDHAQHGVKFDPHDTDVHPYTLQDPSKSVQ